jgi:hypothetical protein
MPGRSFGLFQPAVGSAAESSRSTNQRGSPVAAAIAEQWLRKLRREMKMRLDTTSFNVRTGGRRKPLSMSRPAEGGNRGDE